jgi:hypothetical protein
MLRFILILVAFYAILFFLRVFFKSYRKYKPDLFGNRNVDTNRYNGFDRGKAVEAEFEEIK